MVKKNIDTIFLKKGNIEMLYLPLLLLISFFISHTTPFKITQHCESMPTNIECFLGADIGGTKSKLGIFHIVNEKPILLLSFHLKTPRIANFNETALTLLNYLQDTYAISISHACIAAPGVAT